MVRLPIPDHYIAASKKAILAFIARFQKSKDKTNSTVKDKYNAQVTSIVLRSRMTVKKEEGRFFSLLSIT